MALNLFGRGRQFVERIRNGEIPLITDDRWLPNPIDALCAGSPPRTKPVATTAENA